MEVLEGIFKDRLNGVVKVTCVCFKQFRCLAFTHIKFVHLIFFLFFLVQHESLDEPSFCCTFVCVYVCVYVCVCVCFSWDVMPQHTTIHNSTHHKIQVGRIKLDRFLYLLLFLTLPPG